LRNAGLLAALGCCLALCLPARAASPYLISAPRQADDIDPLRTPWIYYDFYDTSIGCRESEPAVVDAYIASTTGGSVCHVTYTGNDGWPADPDSGSQWADERCDPPESTLLDGYPLTPWAAKPVVRQWTLFNFIHTITHDSCPVNQYDVEQSWGISRVLYKYCPHGYDIRVLNVDGVVDRSVHFCTQDTDVPERDQEGGCLAISGNAGDSAIALGTGGNQLQEVDYFDSRQSGLALERQYNSMSVLQRGPVYATGLFGVNWRSGYERRVEFPDGVSSRTAIVHRGDGGLYFFNLDDGNWRSNSAVRERLVRMADGWEYHARGDVVESYDAQGRLVRLRHGNAVRHDLGYDAQGRLQRVTASTGESLDFAYVVDAPVPLVAAVTDHSGRRWQYEYDERHNLVAVLQPDATPLDDADNPVRRYHYEDTNFPHALTGITDERGVRYATFAYDAGGLVGGRVAARHYGSAGTAGRVEIGYNGNDTYADGRSLRTVTNSRGEVTTYTTTLQHGVALLQGVSGPGCAGCAGGETSYRYDPLTNDLLEKTVNGVTTEYGAYDANGNPGYRIEARGSAAERRTDYTYDPRYFGKPVARSEPSVYPGARRVTSFVYDDFGNLLSERIDGFTPAGEPVSRITTYEYAGPLHQLSRIDGPRTDVNDITTFRYWPFDPGAPTHGPNDGRLSEVEDAGGRLIRHDIQYTPTGKVRYEYDANDVLTAYEYEPGSDRLQRIGISAGGETRYTRWTYLPTGEVESITMAHGTPDGTTVRFDYDDARRLVRVTDGQGNYIRYTLDTEGNVTAEEVFDANGTPSDELDDVLRKVLIRTFDAYNRLDLLVQGDDPLNPLQTLDPRYAPDGTLEQSIDGEGVVTGFSYDALRRLLASTRDLGGTDLATANTLTQYGYDIDDRLTQVIDPVNGSTTYRYDDLGNLLSTDSPDTGLTTYTHDAAGNVISKTMAAETAEAVTLTYSYDALNRLTGIGTTNPDPAHDIRYTWDTCTNGAGRLCAVANGASTVSYGYDRYGNLTTHQGMSYTYDLVNRVKTLTYPSGAVATYHYDPAGQVNALDLSIGGQTHSLASGIAYAPFGGIEALHYGNGHSLAQTRDSAYRITDQAIPGVLALGYNGYDGNGNLRNRTDSLNSSSAFTYDALNRLDTASGHFSEPAIWNYDYDRNGNRTGCDEGVAVALAYTPGSNRLAAIGSADVLLGVAGNTLAKGAWTYSYTPHQRLASATNNGVEVANFAYNGLGQRVGKNPAGSYGRRFFYGREGELLVETDVNGYPLVEYLYLNDQLLAIYHPDADANGETNLQAAQAGNPVVPPDTDGDGLPDNDELLVYGTLPGNPDSDGDGVDDGTEVHYGTNPLDASDFILPGDLDADGQADLRDYLLLTRFVLGMRSPTPAELNAGDLNRNGALDTGDLVQLSRILLEMAWIGLFGSDPERFLLSLWKGTVGAAEAAVTQGALYYVHTDHLGTPQVLTDEAGAVVWRALYDPFGKVEIEGASTVQMNVRFPGQYYDRETGLHYNYFRYYDPETGRYLRSDPIGLVGGLNTYAYAEDNPTNLIDPLGLDSYRCRRTLTRKPGQGTLYGRATQHWYSCVILDDGSQICGGHTASGSFLGSPGRPTTPDEDYYHPKACAQTTDDNDCFDQCLIDEWSKPRPYYDLDFRPGIQCQQYDSDVNTKCRKKCGIK